LSKNRRYIAAVHEAGHAVAAITRGIEVALIVLMDETTEGRTTTGGRTVLKAPADAFTIHAGPWAQARAGWPMPSLDDQDDDGAIFDDYVVGALLSEIDYGDSDLERYRAAGGGDIDQERQWSIELQRLWPVIRALADRLMIGPLTGQAATELVTALWVDFDVAGDA
jgi:hypothetical protein